jgi:RND family efflux transporter MFP subunit
VRGQARANADRWLILQRDGIVSKMDTEARVTEAATAGEEVKNAEAQLIAASEEVAALRAGLKVVEQEIAEAAASLASARARSADAVVVSPVRGFVVSRELEPGAVVSPGTPILKVADPDTAWATVYVDERDARAFEVGDAADITLRSMQGRTLAGRVARIRRESDRVTEQLAVDLSFEERPGQIRLGEQVDAAIRPAPRVVTAIPASALISTREGAGAWTVEGDRLHFRKVRTGVSDRAGWVEVIEGFAPGDTVVTTPGRLADVSNEGRRVRKVSVSAAVAARAGT